MRRATKVAKVVWPDDAPVSLLETVKRCDDCGAEFKAVDAYLFVRQVEGRKPRVLEICEACAKKRAERVGAEIGVIEMKKGGGKDSPPPPRPLQDPGREGLRLSGGGSAPLGAMTPSPELAEMILNYYRKKNAQAGGA